jgi:hypothetical protein
MGSRTSKAQKAHKEKVKQKENLLNKVCQSLMGR